MGGEGRGRGTLEKKRRGRRPFPFPLKALLPSLSKAPSFLFDFDSQIPKRIREEDERGGEKEKERFDTQSQQPPHATNKLVRYGFPRDLIRRKFKKYILYIFEIRTKLL